VTVYEIYLEGGQAHVRLSTREIPRSALLQSFLIRPGPGVSPEEAQYLDTHGNQNGQYDVGDLRAYLKR
jgi:hypothetical protein